MEMLKAKLFRHMALFEGHMPTVNEEDKDKSKSGFVAMEEDEWEAFWRETDLGSDVYTQVLDAVSSESPRTHRGPAT